MDAAQREQNDQIDFATQRLLDDARTIAEADLRAPSLLPGWTRAHVLAHLARNADAMRNLLIGARSGQDRPAYASAQAQDADIERGAALTAKDLIADLADSSMALRALAQDLPDQAWQARVRVLDSTPFPAAELLTRRLVEVELHHCDLSVGYSPTDWPPAFAAMELTEPMRSQRQDRLRYPPPAPEAKTGLPGRPPAPWKPGQRLPGSWLGTAEESRPLPTSPRPGATPLGDRSDLSDPQDAGPHQARDVVELMPEAVLTIANSASSSYRGAETIEQELAAERHAALREAVVQLPPAVGN